MAYYRLTTNKKGHLSAKIQVYAPGLNNEKGKVHYKRIINEDDLPKTKFIKLVEREAIAFEESLEKIYKKSKNGERAIVLTFPELAEEWLQGIERNQSINYHVRGLDVIKKFNQYLKDSNLYDLPINEFTVRHIQLFLNTFGRKPQRGVSKLKKNFPASINFREMARQKIITANSAYRMKRLGKPISTSTAQKICEYNKLNFDEYFEAVESDEFYAAETVKGYRRVLRTIFNEAIRYDWTTKNPVCATKIGVGNNNISLRPVHEKEVFSITESQAFLQALDKLPEDMAYRVIPVKIMLLTGARIGEVHGLRWSDIDFNKNVVHIERSRIASEGHGTYEKEPKTRTSKRNIPLPKSLVEDLIKYQDWFRQADDKFDQHLDSTYIASNVYRQPAGVGTIGNWLTKFEEENGFKHVTCHGLRHTYCSLLLTQNVPIQTVSRYMGHSDSTITLEVYSHFIPDTQERALTALDKITG